MMIFKTSIGIEIAGKDLRVAVLRIIAGQMRFVKGFEISGFRDLPMESRKAAIGAALKVHRLPAVPVFLSLPREHGVVRQIEMPVEVREKLRSTIALQLEALGPWPADEVYWDVGHEPIRKGSRTFGITVAMIPKAALDPWMELFASVNLPLVGASLSSLTWANGIAAFWPGDAPTLALDCEAGHVEGCLVHNGRLTSLTESWDGASGTARVVAERLVSLGRLSGRASPRVVAFGPAAQALGTAERVRLPLTNARPDSTAGFGAIAAALGTLKKTGYRSNLIPKALRYRRSYLQLAPTFVLAALALLVGLLTIMREPIQLAGYALKVEAEIQRLAPEAREASGKQAEFNHLSDRYRDLSAAMKNDYNLEALHELTSVLPSKAWILNYSYQGNSVSVTGLSDSASVVQKLIEDSPLFKDARFSSTVSRTANGMDRFTLKATIEELK